MLLHRDGSGDVRMRLVGLEREVVRLIIEEPLTAVFHDQAWQCSRLATELQLGLFKVVGV